MYRKDNSVIDPLTARTHFPLREVCGRWVSLGGSPDVRIVFTGTRYRLDFSYDTATVFSCPLRQRWGVTFFYLYGRIGLAYDAETDVLSLSAYGDYIRAEEQSR